MSVVFAIGLSGGSGAASGPGVRLAAATGHGANTSGPYDQTSTGATPGNGNASGHAVGEPCAGCVGKADNKNPPGQMPNGSDSNAGYECDRNAGIGQQNPAHTGCQPTTGSTPSGSSTTTPPTTPSGSTTPVTSTSPGSSGSSGVSGSSSMRSSNGSPPGSGVVSSSSGISGVHAGPPANNAPQLSSTGDSSALPSVLIALALLVVGALLLLLARVRRVAHRH